MMIPQKPATVGVFKAYTDEQVEDINNFVLNMGEWTPELLTKIKQKVYGASKSSTKKEKHKNTSVIESSPEKTNTKAVSKFENYEQTKSPNPLRSLSTTKIKDGVLFINYIYNNNLNRKNYIYLL